jgi:hypothetical protein
MGSEKPDWYTNNVCEDYEYVFDMEEKKLVGFMGEPEDRWFCRDGYDVIALLNEQDEKIKQMTDTLPTTAAGVN